ncbi:MAG: DUF4262 domain-containing protein [Kofleriaceae bacterium]|nr:MAG: DUF4262 domain-containing protein [Kofleriaceae bacterium]MBZ0234111.1 DUF4262 domain-containing protein [Kofleriaceae bacterium]
MTTDLRQEALQRIRLNIARHGHHVYLVSGGGPIPRFAYTIGLSETVGAELVFAGGAAFVNEELVHIVNRIAEGRRCDRALDAVFALDALGTFTLRAADTTWVRGLLLGATDYYGRDVRAFQIVPDDEHLTIDVPDMRHRWTPAAEPAWRWHHEAWRFAIPSDSIAATTIAALQGEPIVEATRRDEARWELLADDAAAVKPADVRFVPLGIFLGVDDALASIVELAPEEGLRRDGPRDPWRRWNPPPPAPSLHVAAFICGHVFHRERPVLLVNHAPDGDWQLLCGDVHHDGPRLVGLSHVIDEDESLRAILDLPEGWEAERELVGGPWKRRPWSSEEHATWAGEED